MISQKKSIVYVAREIERAFGMAPDADYSIITNKTPYAETVQKQYPEHVKLIENPGDELLDTAELLQHAAASKLMPADSQVVVFKNNPQIEAVVKTNGWTLLNPSAEIAERIENKITQVEWLGPLAEKYLPKHIVGLTKEISWNKEPLVIQWAHGHTGDGTILVNSDVELDVLKKQFPDRMARASAYAHGPAFTVNVVVTADIVLMGNISYQITGLPPFTDNPFSTVGNDWSLTHSLLSDIEIQYIEAMVAETGAKIQTDGWRGLFGIDLIRDDEHDRICLIEINARQPASATFESFLQEGNRLEGLVGPTVFEAHIAALRGEAIHEALIPLNDGAQIVQRVTKNSGLKIEDSKLNALKEAGYKVISYPNTELNADLLRIQGTRGIMETHGKFNARGKEIVEIVSK